LRLDLSGALPALLALPAEVRLDRLGKEPEKDWSSISSSSLSPSSSLSSKSCSSGVGVAWLVVERGLLCGYKCLFKPQQC